MNCRSASRLGFQPGQSRMSRKYPVEQTPGMHGRHGAASSCPFVPTRLPGNQTRYEAVDGVGHEVIDGHSVLTAHHLASADGTQNRELVGQLLGVVLCPDITMDLDAVELVEDGMTHLQGHFGKGVEAELD
jgi:hypothetical protein